MMEQEEDSIEEINIQEIMQDIRRQILGKQNAGKASLPVSGRRFSPAFYEELYRADMLQGEGELNISVTRSSAPIIGPLIDKLRRKFHQLVLYYVNRAVVPQQEFTDHLFKAITLLSQELEDEVGRSDNKIL